VSVEKLRQIAKEPVAIDPEEVETLVCDWVTLKLLASPQNGTSEAMSAVSLYFLPGQGHARHRHEASEQIIFMIAGKAEMMIEYQEGLPKTRVIAAGELVVIPKGAYHSTFNVGWEPVRILAVYAPAGPEAGMLSSREFTILPPGEIARNSRP
jgi:oxalate decarboxylase/phosphoglucose isomerase-like protein (cupin superfamily)